MRKFILPALLGSAATLAACTPATPVAVATTSANVCGTYGYVDINNDGFITGNEWNTYRTSSYAHWDLDRDGRISRAEFENCYRAGGFYRSAYYNPDYWPHYWTAFDADGNGYLSTDEYWSASAWARIDRNGNGRIDADEWVWWP